MIAILKRNVTDEQTKSLTDWLKAMDLDVHISKGREMTVLGLIGDTSRVDMDLLRSLDMVESVKRVSEPYKQANRKFHPQDTIVEAGGVRIGGRVFCHDRRPLLRGIRRTNYFRGPERSGSRGDHPPGRRFQAPDPLLILSRASGTTASGCCWKPRRPRVCPSSRKS